MLGDHFGLGMIDLTPGQAFYGSSRPNKFHRTIAGTLLSRALLKIPHDYFASLTITRTCLMSHLNHGSRCNKNTIEEVKATGLVG